MYWVESILMIAGISLDLFAGMEIEGAMLARVKPRLLFGVAFVVLVLQIGFFVGGYSIGNLLIRNNFLMSKQGDVIGNAIAMVGFGLLGARLIIKAIRKDNIQERCRELPISKYVWIFFVATIYTLFAGIAQGLMGGNILFMVVLLVCCTFAVTVSGLFTGYRFGFKMKSWFYGFGAGLLWSSALGILFIGIIPVVANK